MNNYNNKINQKINNSIKQSQYIPNNYQNANTFNNLQNQVNNIEHSINNQVIQQGNTYIINNLYLNKNYCIKESKNGVLIEYKNLQVWINKTFIKTSIYTNFISIGINESWEYTNNLTNEKIKGIDLYNYWVN